MTHIRPIFAREKEIPVAILKIHRDPEAVLQTGIWRSDLILNGIACIPAICKLYLCPLAVLVKRRVQAYSLSQFVSVSTFETGTSSGRPQERSGPPDGRYGYHRGREPKSAALYIIAV